MEIRQIFETTIFSDDHRSEARFIVVPRAAYPRLPESRNAFHELGLSLGFNLMREIQREPGKLVDALAECLAASENRVGEVVTPERFIQLVRFAEILAIEPVVPFRRNPLNLEPLASIISSASGVGLGAWAGFVVGAGSPLTTQARV
jgi:hypothetical protein